MRRALSSYGMEATETPLYKQRSFLSMFIIVSVLTVLAQRGDHRFAVLRDELLTKQGFTFFSCIAMIMVGLLALTIRRKHSGLDQNILVAPAIVRDVLLGLAGALIGWSVGLFPEALREGLRSMGLCLAIVVAMSMVTLVPYAVCVAMASLASREIDRRFRRTKMWVIRWLGAILIILGATWL